MVSVRVTPGVDFLDEPALDVLVDLETIRGVTESMLRGDMLAKLDAVLREAATNAQPIWRFPRLTRVATRIPTSRKALSRSIS